MSTAIRDNVPAATAVLSIASIGLVVAAVRGVIPAGSIPSNRTVVTAVPHLNAAISAAAIVTILLGWYWIRRGAVRRHRLAMLAATLLFAGFLVLYLYKVVLEGPSPFPGPPALYATLYLPVLVIHMALAILCIPLVYYVLLVGLTHPVDAIPSTRHPRVGRVAAPLWITSFALGIAVYAMLYVVW